MKPVVWAGICSIVLGGLLFAYQKIDYARARNILDVGPVRVTTEARQQIPLPPVFGGLAIVGGVVLLGVGASSKA
jgi:hypothetical protein